MALLVPMAVAFGSAGFAPPKLKLGVTVAVEAADVVELLLAGVDAVVAEVTAGDELKLKPGVIDGPVGF